MRSTSTADSARLALGRSALLSAVFLAPGVSTALADDSIEELKALLKAQQASIQALQAQVEIQQKSIQAMEARNQARESTAPAPIASAPPRRAPADPPARPVHAAAPTAPSQPAAAERPLAQAPKPMMAPKEPEAPEASEPSLNQAGVELYGFAQADLIYDAEKMDPDWNSTLRPSKIPIHCPPNGNDPGCGTNGETNVSVRQSRFGVKTMLPTAWGDFKTLFEFDLFGVGANAGQTTFRLRHIWGEVGQFGAGQTWSVFMDPDVFPNTIDYWGPAGMIFLRNPQLRWTPYNSGGTKVALALESPSSALDQGKASEVSPDLGPTVKSRNEWPDLTAQFRTDQDWGHFQASGIVRSVGYQVTGSPGGKPSQSLVGWGFNLGTGLRTWGKDQLLLQAAYGSGIASYINDGGIDLAPNGRLQGETVPLLGWLAYYDHWWTERWSSSLGVSQNWQPNLAGQTPNAFHSGMYASGNVLYHPLENLMVGMELLWGRLEQNDGQSADDTRIQFSAKYRFGATFNGTAFQSVF